MRYYTVITAGVKHAWFTKISSTPTSQNKTLRFLSYFKHDSLQYFLHCPVNENNMPLHAQYQRALRSV